MPPTDGSIVPATNGAPTTKPLSREQVFAGIVQTTATKQLTEILGSEAGRLAAARVALAFRQVARTSPNIYDCTPASVASAIAMCAMTGLMPGGPYPTVYVLPRLVSYKDESNRWHKRHELQWQISARGGQTLVQRAGYNLKSVIVWAQDEFVNDPAAFRPAHRPAPEPVKAWEAVVGAYVVCYRLSDGAYMGWEWMDRADIEKRRAHSDAWKRGQSDGATDRDRSSPWYQWWEEMIRKTAIRYAVSRGICPLDDVGQIAFEADGKGDIIDTTATPVPERRQLTSTAQLDEALGLNEDREHTPAYPGSSEPGGEE